ncbi:MAG: tRNA glutamyl-Q(34) synthetase GluQRS [Phycisphaerales bacterium]|jgi:glutamyl-tRNA synthetase|nr:tRNA glutamyl-Q(34) synthetase GluQRS [Phycisphaerales bacterium]MBT7170806.1 tRNA glutamyl-Q(34) synthetase GluQRS [Phycisphaerales bacterium]
MIERMEHGITRLAPSPTGALHLGNARTFVVNWLLARQRGWRVLYRLEDLDTARTKPGSAEATESILRWLGLDWDDTQPRQSTRTEAYLEALSALRESSHVYPCICSRKDIALAASAPHVEDGVVCYPGTCRGRFATADEAQAQAGRLPAWRFDAGESSVPCFDQFAGEQTFYLPRIGGDFVVYRNENIPGYQLAVVVDDHAGGVNRIVRGDDLLDSTARQTLLRGALGYTEAVEYYHLPLVLDEEGNRLAKRRDDIRLEDLRASGVAPEAVLGVLAYWCGSQDAPEPMSLTEWLAKFDIETLPADPVNLTPSLLAKLAR